MAGLNDTHPESEQVLRAAYRKMTFAAKWRQMGAIYRTARFLHAAGFRDRNPHTTEEMILDDSRKMSLGAELYEKVKEEMAKRNAGKNDM